MRKLLLAFFVLFSLHFATAHATNYTSFAVCSSTLSSAYYKKIIFLSDLASDSGLQDNEKILVNMLGNDKELGGEFAVAFSATVILNQTGKDFRVHFNYVPDYDDIIFPISPTNPKDTTVKFRNESYKCDMTEVYFEIH